MTTSVDESAEAALAAAIDSAFGDAMRADDDICVEVWSALASVDWRHSSGAKAGLTWRGAGVVVAEISRKGDYVTWYNSGPSGTIAPAIATAMAALGWTGSSTWA